MPPATISTRSGNCDFRRSVSFSIGLVTDCGIDDRNAGVLGDELGREIRLRAHREDVVIVSEYLQCFHERAVRAQHDQALASHRLGAWKGAHEPILRAIQRARRMAKRMDAAADTALPVGGIVESSHDSLLRSAHLKSRVSGRTDSSLGPYTPNSRSACLSLMTPLRLASLRRGERPPACTALRMVSINGAHRNPDIRSGCDHSRYSRRSRKVQGGRAGDLAAARGDPQQVALATLIERSTNTGARVCDNLASPGANARYAPE